jgi:gliding motility-associated-like protein
LEIGAYVKVRHPVANFTTSKHTPCGGDSVAFTNTSTGATGLVHKWTFGDNDSSFIKSPKHAYTNSGIYYVTLKVTDSTSCEDTKRDTIQVFTPKASFTKNKAVSVCPPLFVDFTNTSANADKYDWDFGNGGAHSNLTNVSNVPYRNSGKYIITLTAIDGVHGCSSVAKDSVFVLGYNGAFAYTPVNGCLPQQVAFSVVVGNIPKIRWDFGDGSPIDSSLNSAPVSHTYTSSGPFHPVVIYSDPANCTYSVADSGLIPIRVDKVKADFSSSIPCLGVPFTLTQKSGAVYDAPVIFKWNLSPGDSTGPSTSYAVNSSGPHPITLIATNSWGCSDTITKNIFINPLPLIDAGPPDTGICPGDTIMLTGHGGLSYVWGPDSIVSCTACTTTLAWTARPTTYFVIGTDSNGCINKDSITARIQIKTTAEVKPGGEVCIGETYRLSASGATIYHWTPAQFLDSPDIASPLATPIITTSYVVESHEGTCLVRYDTVKVEVHPSPFFDAGHDQIINYGASVMLDPTKTGIAKIEWRQDSTLSCLDCFDPIAHPTYATMYYAKAYSEYGCVDSDSVYVRVRCNGDSVFIPNTFTPNGDGLNDFFYPRGKGLEHILSFRVFNRWGELVFERTSFSLNDERMGWDGTFKGKQLPPDVYMYSINARCQTGEPVNWKGDVTIVR